MMTGNFDHALDLSEVSHNPGQSPDLEPKRRRAWARLGDDERRYIVSVYDAPVTGWELPCLEAGGSYERVLHVLVTTGRALSPDQIAYLLIARHYRNSDPTSLRKQLAVGVRRGHMRWAGRGRYAATDEGVLRLREVEQAWRIARYNRRMALLANASHRRTETPQGADAGPFRAPGPQRDASGSTVGSGHALARPAADVRGVPGRPPFRAGPPGRPPFRAGPPGRPPFRAGPPPFRAGPPPFRAGPPGRGSPGPRRDWRPGVPGRPPFRAGPPGRPPFRSGPPGRGVSGRPPFRAGPPGRPPFRAGPPGRGSPGGGYGYRGPGPHHGSPPGDPPPSGESGPQRDQARPSQRWRRNDGRRSGPGPGRDRGGEGRPRRP